MGCGVHSECRRWYEPHLERLYDHPVVRVGDLEKLEQIASGYTTRERFLTELTLDPPEATGAEAGAPLLDEDYLIMSTIHSAKGREMGCGLHSECRGWLHTVRHGDE